MVMLMTMPTPTGTMTLLIIRLMLTTTTTSMTRTSVLVMVMAVIMMANEHGSDDISTNLDHSGTSKHANTKPMSREAPFKARVQLRKIGEG